MREDMFKVIVERPRNSKNFADYGRSRRDDLDEATFAPMRFGYAGVHLNENLAPLKRYLRSQINRPWNRVYSELRENIDPRSTVKQHVLQHVEDFVAIKTWRQDGEIWLDGGRSFWQSGPIKLVDTRRPLYVSPESGLLLPNKNPSKQRNPRKEKCESELLASKERRIVVSETEQLICINHIWYRVVVARLPRSPRRDPQTRWCAVRSALVSINNEDKCAGDVRRGNKWLFGDADCYAIEKRQLGKRDLRLHGL